MNYKNNYNNIFALFGCFRIEGPKQHSSDFVIEEYKKGRPTFIFDIFG